MSATLINTIGRLKDSPGEPRKLKIILGNGNDSESSTIRYPTRLLDTTYSGNPADITPEEHKQLWVFYEYARYKTYNQYPDQLLYYILKLSKLKMVSTLITTNYDSYWQSIKDRKAFSHPIAINPLTTTTNGDGYYQKPLRGSHLAVLMIHGRLDFVRFNSCNHRFRLPNFIINSYPIEILNEFKIPTGHNWLGGSHPACIGDVN
ncbi:MAG: hypothetical protein L7F78_17655, partial [Syntrophales bacterium LBB04]|nr:hypothetical protein [Syntrophales bacterium LBB04]